MTTSLAPVAPSIISPVETEVGLVGRLDGNRYVLPSDTPIESWLSDGVVLQEMEKRVGFWLGDWLRTGEELYGERRYTQALQATGYAHQTLKNARRVALKFPAEVRTHEGLAFAHYDAVAALPPGDADELLREASSDRLSSKGLRERVQFRQAQIREAERATLPVPPLRLSEVELLVANAVDLPITAGTVHLVVTSPPYALEKAYAGGGDATPASWFDLIRATCVEALRVAAPGGRFALNVPLDTTLGGFRPTYAQAVSAGIAAGWTYRSSIVWIDNELGKSTARGSYDQETGSGTAAAPSIIAPAEMIVLFSKGPWWRETPPDRPSDILKDDWLSWTNGCWQFPGEMNPWADHPAPFPEELPRRLIHLLSFPGDLVLDPFMGSGTTAVAAVKAGRRFVGADVDRGYVNDSQRRLAALCRVMPGLTEMSGRLWQVPRAGAGAADGAGAGAR